MTKAEFQKIERAIARIEKQLATLIRRLLVREELREWERIRSGLLGDRPRRRAHR
jgi:hypothetical protein